MKTLVIATSMLALTAGFAAAEVTLSGDARMGVISDFGTNDMAFTSRARVKFTLSGATDGGLEFGASFRAADAVGAANGTAGSVFISGAFGKLSMGDVDGAANSAIGQVSGVGLTGLSDLNEIRYLSNGGTDFSGDASDDPMALYEYSTGDLTIYASVTNPSGEVDAYAVGAKYAMGDYSVSLAYENADFPTFTWSQILVGGSAKFGGFTVKAVYGQTDETNGTQYNQYALSADYTMDALTVTAFYADTEDFNATIHPDSAKSGVAYGLGASYDLGGGAAVVGGYSRNETSDEDAFDLGVSMSF